MTDTLLRSTVLALGIVAIGGGVAAAQSASPAVAAGAGAGVVWETYRFATPTAANLRRLSLLTLPLGAQLPLGDNVSLSVRSHWARAVLDRVDGSSADLAGFTDTEIRLGFTVGRPLLSTVINLIGVAPTGNTTHGAEEADVAGAIAADLLRFRISHWGAGGALGAGAGISTAGRAGSLGVSAAYVVGREFEPLVLGDDARFAYRPGNQLQLRGALESYVGGTGKVTLAMVAQIHDDDQHEGTNLYRAGNRYHAIGSYASSIGGWSTALAYAGALRRERGTALLEQVGPAPAQTLLLAGVGFRGPAGPVVFLPSVDVRLHRIEDGVGQGHLVSFGTAVEWPVGTIALVPLLRVHTGNVLIREGQTSPITGFELGITSRLLRR